MSAAPGTYPGPIVVSPLPHTWTTLSHIQEAGGEGGARCFLSTETQPSLPQKFVRPFYGWSTCHLGRGAVGVIKYNLGLRPVLAGGVGGSVGSDFTVKCVLPYLVVREGAWWVQILGVQGGVLPRSVIALKFVYIHIYYGCL